MLIRRSNLIVRLADSERVREAWRHDADAITLAPDDADDAAGRIRASIEPLRRGGAEVFVQVHAPRASDELRAAIWPGIRGIVLANVDAPAQVTRAVSSMEGLERERGLAAGSLTFILLLATARAVWEMRAIVRASERISQVGLDERALARSLRIECVPECDPFVYARGRLAIECAAAKLGAIGMAWPMSVFEDAEAGHAHVHGLALKAKNLGMKGILCPHPQWVAPVNAAFTPTPELVIWNRRVRDAFAAGVAAGTAAVPLDGKMIDVPVDEWAKVVLDTAEACAARDAEKAAARERAAGLTPGAG